MLETTPDGRAVHFPKNPEKFEFDSEVSAAFGDIAKRAIPNFYEAHAAHARMLGGWIKQDASFLDIGASRGAFFKALCDEHPEVSIPKTLRLSAIDNSQTMCDYLCDDYPTSEVYCADISDPVILALLGTYDVVCLHYVLQFIHPDKQALTLQRLMDSVKPGGVFIYGHKAKHYGALGQLTHDEYIRFRMNNGYTREEIEAKTLALKGSMFPVDHNMVMNMINANFSHAVETFRFMMFSAVFAVK